jgi:hypothetical protein
MRIFFYYTEPSDMVFDPDQDPEEKRVVRQNYRSLAKKIEGMHTVCYYFTLYLYRKSRGPK